MNFESHKPSQEEIIARAKKDAENDFSSMDLDLLQRFADGTVGEEEYMDNAPTLTDGFNEEDSIEIAKEILEKRKSESSE